MYKIIALMGEAGSGKDTMMQEVLKLNSDLHEIVSCTTRPPREGEVEGVNYFFYTPEKFGDKVLNDEMLEATCFNDWFYGTSYESIRSDCVNIGVFNPAGIESLLVRPDVELKLYYINTEPKERLIRQLNREQNPDVDEIIRRYKTDREDFCDIETDFPYEDIPNNNEKDLWSGSRLIADFAQSWSSTGTKQVK